MLIDFAVTENCTMTSNSCQSYNMPIPHKHPTNIHKHDTTVMVVMFHVIMLFYNCHVGGGSSRSHTIIDPAVAIAVR